MSLTKDDLDDWQALCPRCADDECEHGLRECDECGGVDCSLCASKGWLDAQDHPDWCHRCGMSGRCPECDPD
jgi:hypothetical protein